MRWWRRKPKPTDEDRHQQANLTVQQFVAAVHASGRVKPPIPGGTTWTVSMNSADREALLKAGIESWIYSGLAENGWFADRGRRFMGKLIVVDDSLPSVLR